MEGPPFIRLGSALPFPLEPTPGGPLPSPPTICAKAEEEEEEKESGAEAKKHWLRIHLGGGYLLTYRPPTQHLLVLSANSSPALGVQGGYWGGCNNTRAQDPNSYGAQPSGPTVGWSTGLVLGTAPWVL